MTPKLSPQEFEALLAPDIDTSEAGFPAARAGCGPDPGPPAAGDNLPLPSALDRIHEQFAVHAAASLTALSGVGVEMERLTGGALAAPLGHVPFPVALSYAIRLGPSGPLATIHVEGALVTALLCRLFGTTLEADRPGPNLNDEEAGVMRHLLRKILADLSRAWALVHPLEPEIVTAKADPGLAALDVSASRRVELFCIRFPQAAGCLAVAYPEEFIRSVFPGPALAVVPGTGRPSAEERVAVSVELGHACLDRRAAARLAPGQLIELDHAAANPVDIVIGGCRVARGEVVVVGDRFAVRVTELAGRPAGDAGFREEPEFRSTGTWGAAWSGR